MHITVQKHAHAYVITSRTGNALVRCEPMSAEGALLLGRLAPFLGGEAKPITGHPLLRDALRQVVALAEIGAHFDRWGDECPGGDASAEWRDFDLEEMQAQMKAVRKAALRALSLLEE